MEGKKMEKPKKISFQSLSFNKIFLFLILSVLFFAAFSVVDAADININNSTQGGLGKAIDDSNNGDKINLDNGVYTNNVTDIYLSKNLTITGKDPKSTVIDARKQGRIFWVSRSLILINLTLINGYVGQQEYGGAVNNYGNLTLVNCIVTSNTGYNGGAIFNGGTLTINNSIFFDNIATERGGAIYNDYDKVSSGGNANLTIINSNFTNNIGTWGGAIYDQNAVNLTIIDSTFENNTATASSGGSIYTGPSDKILINNSKFINNNANVGGAISCHSRNSSIINSIFINNSANVAGAMNLYGNSDGSIINCSFINNFASNYGGALRTYSSRTIINGSKFINNSATNYGGALYNYADLTIINSDFKGNNASYGGAYFNQGDNSKIINSNFTNNLANYAGAIYNSASSLSVSGNNMSSNVANILANEIYNSGTMNILNLKYLNNSIITVNNNTQIILYATLTDDMGNPITGQEVTFLINGFTVGYANFINGMANLTYFINLNTNQATVNGAYLGSGNNINILNGILRVNSISAVNGNISLNNDQYYVNDPVKGVINLANNGPNIVYNIIIKFILPSGFNINKSDIIVSQGFYDFKNDIWYVGDLVSTAKAMMVFTGEFNQKGQYIQYIDISGDNFNSSIDSVNVSVKEKTLNSELEPSSNTTQNSNKPNIRLIKRVNSKAVRHGNIVYMKWLTFKNLGISGSQILSSKVIYKNFKYKLWKVYNKKIKYQYAKNKIRFKVTLKSNKIFKLKLKVYRPIKQR